MKRSLKISVDYISEFAADLLRLSRGYLMLPNTIKYIKKNKKIKDKFKNESVIILANGPSVNDINVSYFENKNVIVMNSFANSSLADVIKQPVAYCFGEPYGSPAWSDPSNLINKSDSQTFWVNSNTIGKINTIEKSKSPLLHFAHCCYEPRIFQRNRIDLSKPTLVYQTTAQLSIMVALHLGFKKITLLGFDHTWLASPKFSKHYYSDDKDSDDYLHKLSYFEIICFMRRMYQIYYSIENLANQSNVEIRNKNSKSYLDIFEFDNE